MAKVKEVPTDIVEELKKIIGKESERTNQFVRDESNRIRENLKAEIISWINEELDNRLKIEVKKEIARIFREMGRI